MHACSARDAYQLVTEAKIVQSIVIKALGTKMKAPQSSCSGEQLARAAWFGQLYNEGGSGSFKLSYLLDPAKTHTVVVKAADALRM